MNELQMKVCSLCGQCLMCEADTDPRNVCTCDSAKTYQYHQSIYEARLGALEKLCGSECEKVHADYQPIGEETYDLLKQIVRGVCFQQIGKMKFALLDGTELSIAESGIKRSVKITTELSR